MRETPTVLFDADRIDQRVHEIGGADADQQLCVVELMKSCLVEHIREHEPRTLKVAGLIDRTQGRKIELTPDWAMFAPDEPLDDRFLVGDGLDVEERDMGLPYIGRSPATARERRADS